MHWRPLPLFLSLFLSEESPQVFRLRFEPGTYLKAGRPKKKMNHAAPSVSLDIPLMSYATPPISYATSSIRYAITPMSYTTPSMT